MSHNAAPHHMQQPEEAQQETKQEPEENDFLNELELKLGEFPLVVDTVSSFINPKKNIFPNSKISDLAEQEIQLLNRIKDNTNGIFLRAAKYGKGTIVDFLINCGVDANVIDNNGESAADYAWDIKDFKMLLSLLQADSFFPQNFNLNELGEDDGSAKEIKHLLDGRNHLHKVIENGTVEDVKSIKFNENSRFYLNVRNQSAAYAALNHKKFLTYAYLKSVGAEFATNLEKRLWDVLEDAEKLTMREALVQYFPNVPNSHIFYLTSKSRSQKPMMNLSDKLIRYYNILDQIPEISVILKVIQFADYVDIIFDFDEEDISKVNPMAFGIVRGEANYKEGRIYIAASPEKRKEEEILGTIAHELTHMAMQMLYENDCNPYDKFDEESIKFFKSFKTRIRNDVKKEMFDASKILLAAMNNYPPSDHDSELIVRIPHILAEYKNGKDWLKKNIPDLLKFYKEKIVEKSKYFINESVILKPKGTIKSINESVGEIIKLKNCNLFFKKVTNLMEKNEKNQIFIYNVQSTLLGTLKVLQGLFEKSYTNFYNKFLVLNFKNFIIQLIEISQAFYLEASNVLILEISYNPSKLEMYTACDKISEILKGKPHKKIIFVAHRNIMNFFRISLKENYLLDVCEEISDNDLGFDHLDVLSQEQLLKKRVRFQGKPIILKRLIQAPDLCKVINPGIIEKLLEGRDVNIGNEIGGFSNSEGPYSDINQDIHFESFVREVKNSDGIFIIRSKNDDDIVIYFEKNFKGIEINADFLKNKSYDFEIKISKEKIYLVGDPFKSKHFKNFCKMNAGKKCHLIDVKDSETNSFVLKELYNPDFYMKRKVKKIFVKYDQMEELVEKNTSEIFIFSAENTKNLLGENHNNVKWLNKEEAANTFKALKESTVHWFQMEEGIFTWKNSHGSVKNLRPYIRNTKSGNQFKIIWQSSPMNSHEFGNSPMNCDLDLLEEENLISEIAVKKIVLIAGDPGMGKSTTLTKLYGTKLISENHWIIRINLKDHIKALRENINSKELNIHNVIQFLQEVEPNLQNELNVNLLRFALTTKNSFSKCLLVAFDGFDEVLDEDDREKITQLLKFLKNETRCKIWITSRLHYKNDLENDLDTFAFEFHPLDGEQKNIFVEKYLKDRLNLILNRDSEIFSDKKDSKISVFTKNLLLKMNEIFKDDVKEFVGTPLQLNLVMLGSVEYFKDWAEKDEELEFTYLGKNLLELYENFIKKKYEIHFKKKDIIEKKRQKKDFKDSEKFNRDLAESLIYQGKTLKPEDDDKEIILLIGLIQSRNDKDFEFIHFTFREYYFAEVLAKYLLSEEIPPSFKEKMIFLFKKILVEEQFIMIRYFLNIRLKNKSPERKLNEFKNDLDQILEHYTIENSALAVAACEGHENIFNVVYSTYLAFPSYKMTNILNRTLFIYCSICGNWQIFERLLEILKNLKSTQNWEHFYYKALICDSVACAARRNKWDFVKMLLEKIEQSFSKNDIYFYTTRLIAVDKLHEDILEYDYYKFPEIYDVLVKMVDVIPNEKQYEVLMKNPNVIHRAINTKDSRLVKFYFEKCEELMQPEEECKMLMMRGDSGGTILHTAVLTNRLEICKLILKKIEKNFDTEQQGEFLMFKEDGLTVLCCATIESQIEIVKLLVEKAEKIFNSDRFFDFILTSRSEIYTTLNKNNLECIKFLFEKVEKEDQIRWLTNHDHFKPSFFHEVCSSNDPKYLNLVSEKLRNISKSYELFMARDKQNNNCLHLAVQNGDIKFVKLLFQLVEQFLSLEEQRKLIMMKNDLGGTVLHHVAFQSEADVDVVKFLLEKTEKILRPETWRELFTMKVNSNSTFLHLAVWAFPIEIIKFLLKKYELVLAQDQYLELLNESKILHFAFFNKNSEVAEFIFEKIENILDQQKLRQFLMATDVENQTFLHFAAKKNRKKFMGLFFESMEKILTPEDQCQLLLMKNISNGETFLHEAACNSEPDLVRFLFEKTNEILTIEKRREFLLMTNLCNKNALNRNYFYSPDTKSEVPKLILDQMENTLTYEEQREFLLDLLQTVNFEKCASELGITWTKNIYNIELITLLIERGEKLLKSEDQRMPNTTMTKDYLHFLNEVLRVALICAYHETGERLFEYIEKRFPLEIRRDILMIKSDRNKNESESLIMKLIRRRAKDSRNKNILQEISSRPHLLFQGSLLNNLQKILTSEDLHQLFMELAVFDLEHWPKFFEHYSRLYAFDKENTVFKEELSKLFMEKIPFRKISSAIIKRKFDDVKMILSEGKRLLTSETFGTWLMTFRNDVLSLAASRNNVLSPFLTHVEFRQADTEEQNFLHLYLTETESILTPEKQRKFLTKKNKKNRNALYLAAINGNTESVKLLLQAAEKNMSDEDLQDFIMAKDFENKTALQRSDIITKNLLTIFIKEKIDIDIGNEEDCVADSDSDTDVDDDWYFDSDSDSDSDFDLNDY